MTPREEAPVTVTQETRELLADLFDLGIEQRAEIMDGKADHKAYIISKLTRIERFRTQSSVAAKAREERLREALEELVGAFSDPEAAEIDRTLAMRDARAALSASDGEAPHA